ncbi:hypothetical protein BSIN_1634 [Burkholderia singularis]|uniref:Uncharacterized protein n=1 Tax=Burkholderia singularis TaxID=1503053 RepID=A0A238GZF1_9BURK|nr:hypothetical protein BSIN_1634 [Burkholderia singularis]
MEFFVSLTLSFRKDRRRCVSQHFVPCRIQISTRDARAALRAHPPVCEAGDRLVARVAMWDR